MTRVTWKIGRLLTVLKDDFMNIRCQASWQPAGRHDTETVVETLILYLISDPQGWRERERELGMTWDFKILPKQSLQL